MKRCAPPIPNHHNVGRKYPAEISATQYVARFTGQDMIAVIKAPRPSSADQIILSATAAEHDEFARKLAVCVVILGDLGSLAVQVVDIGADAGQIGFDLR